MKKNLNIAYLNGAEVGKKIINVVETINNQDKTIDITENGSVEVVADNEYSGLSKVTVNVEVPLSGSIWTGHVDVEGLKAIGWDNEDIAYFQEHGVNWMEEDDEYYKVSDDNKALYGVLTADNIREYKDRIVWLPKIDFSAKTNLQSAFKNFNHLIGLPLINTSSNVSLESAFVGCYHLTCIPRIDLSKTASIYNCFSSCYNLQYLPKLSLPNGYTCAYAFQYTRVLASVDISTNSNNGAYMFYNNSCIRAILGNLTFDSAESLEGFLCNCFSLRYVEPVINSGSVTNLSNFANGCSSLYDIKIKNLRFNISFSASSIISKQSILFIIENEAATEPITITLHETAYARLSTDPDIVAALENHPLVSLASA